MSSSAAQDYATALQAAFDAVITDARDEYQAPTLAEFDYHLGIGHENVLQAIDNAIYRHARNSLGTAPMPYAADLDRLTAEAAALRTRLAPLLENFITSCRHRRYTGWSRWSTGPIQYA